MKDPSMGIQVSPETEARLAAAARQQGVSVDELLQRLNSERSSLTSTPRQSSDLPLWHLASIGYFHRRDIYDDAGRTP
jgi:hypothetical protein